MKKILTALLALLAIIAVSSAFAIGAQLGTSGTPGATGPPAMYTINASSQNSSGVPWSSVSMINTGTSMQIQARVVNIWSRIKKRADSMFRDTIGIVFDEAGDVTQYMTKRLTSFGSRFSIAVEQITSSSTIIFPSLQSLACSASFKADDITRTTTIEGKMGPGDPGATMSRVCGMKMIHEDCDYHAPGDPPVTTEVFCQVP